MNKGNWNRVDDFLEMSTHNPEHPYVAAKSTVITPGCVLLVGQGGRVVYHKAFGSKSLLPEVSPTSTSTVYDVASLTKVMVSTLLIMKMVERGQLDLEKRLSHVLQTFGTHGKEKITLRNLLTHSSGLPAHIPYYQEIQSLNQSSRTGLQGSKAAAQYIYNEIFRSELEYEPGSKSVYSDVGYLLMGQLIESISCGLTLDRYATKEIFKPLGLQSTGYIDLSALKLKQLEAVTESIAPTAQCPWRDKLLCAEVHDENAWAMGGVAPHAGVFSTAEDVHRVARVLLESYRGESEFLNRDVMRLFWERDRLISKGTWALGWDTPSSENSSSGKYFSETSVGHLGYTGCSLWIDIEREVDVVLLTNRVHPSAENKSIKQFRPAVHDLVMETLGNT